MILGEAHRPHSNLGELPPARFGGSFTPGKTIEWSENVRHPELRARQLTSNGVEVCLILGDAFAEKTGNGYRFHGL